MSQVGKFLNLKPHMSNWGVYNENGPYTSANTIGSLSPAQFGGLSYMILAEKGGDVYVIQTEIYGRCAIWAPRDEDSTISYERVFSNGDSNGSGGGTVVPGTGGTGKYLNLKPHMTSWGVYNENGPYTSANSIGKVYPAQFGGLSYEILAEKGGDVYVIQTESLGRCAIWAPADDDSSITTSPVYTGGSTGGGSTGGTGKYLNLNPHMTSWGVYNENGPYISAYTIGSLAPAQFDGLSYEILAEKGGDVYVIKTETYGRCAIWAPRDNDSSITTSPAYSSGGTTGGTGGTGKYLNLNPHMTSWGVYNQNGPYTSAYSIGKVYPAQFSGVSYEILAEKGGDVYVIRTESFGLCAIWAPRDEDSSITSSPVYTGSGSTGGGSNPGTGTGGVEIPGGLKVFIDPGHGGSDPGAVGNGLSEKNIVLSISKKVGIILNNYGVSVKYSRETDTFVDLAPRAQMANNWGANLFVSIHANSASAPATGTECFTHPSDVAKTKDLSAKVALAISNKLGIPNRGHKEEDFAVLRVSSMPAILVETAFINSSNDANLLVNKQDVFAETIANEILKYLNISLTKPPINTDLGYIKELVTLAKSYLNEKRLTITNESVNKEVLNYLRAYKYCDTPWIAIIGGVSTICEYVHDKNPTLHNKLSIYIKGSTAYPYKGQKIDLAHLAATTLGYLYGKFVPNFWTGWGADLASAMSDIQARKANFPANEVGTDLTAATFIIGHPDCKFSVEDIEADVDSIYFSREIKNNTLDILFENYYSTGYKERKSLYVSDINKIYSNTEFSGATSLKDKIFCIMISNSQGFGLLFEGIESLKNFALLSFTIYNKIGFPNMSEKEAICTAFANYIESKF